MRAGVGRRARVFALSLAVAACAGQAKPPESGRQAKKAVTETARAGSPRARLAEALRSIPRPRPVLDALPEDARKRLEARLAGLDAERRLAVHNEESPLVDSLPLLHLASGGTSPRALFALATTSAGADELSGLLGVEHSAPDGAAIAIVRDFAERAALNFLRDRAADVPAAGKATPLVCRLVARAAQAVGRREIALLARELLADFEPSSENKLGLAEELARATDPERAAQLLADAEADKQHPPTQAAVSAVKGAIQAARFVVGQRAKVPDPALRLALARAWLRLGRITEARALLEPEAASARTQLSFAAALAETMIENPACPELPQDVGSLPLCAESFRTSERVRSALALLDSAWHAGGGRDDEALEVYAALAQVIPWMQQTALGMASAQLTPAEAGERVSALRAKIQEIVAVAPRLAGLSLFIETLHNDVTKRALGLRTDADATALTTRALQLASSDSSRFAQAGVLAVAAALSRQQDISALVDAVPAEQTEPSLRVARAALNVWAAASSGASARMDGARGELAAIMAEGRGTSLERARLVLSVSEADALLAGTDRSYQLLSRVAGQLLSESIPPDLAFRAVLDASGALAHGKRVDRAREILSGAAAAQLPAGLDRASDLLQLIRGYKLMLAIDGGSLDGLVKARAQLDALKPPSGSESVTVWFELWSAELWARQADIACQKQDLRQCQKAQSLRRKSHRALDPVLGAESCAVLMRGTLPGGSFEAGFRFSAEAGLQPFIVFDPSLLAIGLPKFTID